MSNIYIFLTRDPDYAPGFVLATPRVTNKERCKKHESL